MIYNLHLDKKSLKVKSSRKFVSRSDNAKVWKKISRGLKKREKALNSLHYDRLEIKKTEYKIPKEKEIGFRINELRKKRKYTIRELSSYTNTSPSQICRMLNGERGTNIESLIVFSQFFEVPMEYIIYGEKKKTEYDDLYQRIARTSKSLSVEERVKLIELLAKPD